MSPQRSNDASAWIVFWAGLAGLLLWIYSLVDMGLQWMTP